MSTADPLRSTIRRLPVPSTEPPYDHERPAPPPHTQGTLALVFGLPSGVPATPEPPAQLRLVPDPVATSPTPDPETLADPVPTSSGQLPDPRRWTAKLSQALSEVLCGQRPAQQLVRWTTEDVYTALVDRIGPLNRRPSVVRMTGLRATVRALRVCEPRDGIVEASVVVQQGDRYRAIAMRLEGLDGRWQCTSLDLV